MAEVFIGMAVISAWVHSVKKIVSSLLENTSNKLELQPQYLSLFFFRLTCEVKRFPQCHSSFYCLKINEYLPL